MKGRTTRTAFLPAAVATLAAVAAPAAAQELVQQVLDSVYTNSRTHVAEMPFNDPTKRNPAFDEFTRLSISGSNLVTCKLTAIDGLFCLDGKLLKQAKTPRSATAFETVLSCESIPALDARKPNTCTTLTVGIDGRIWLGGKEKGKAYNLLEIRRGLPCPPAFTLVAGTDACWREVETGRPLLVAISSIDGDLARNLSIFGAARPGGGLLLLEQRTDAVFIDFATETPVLVADKFDWGLRGNTGLQDITLLQVVDDATGAVRNVILATDDDGRVLALDADTTAPAIAVFDIPSNREATSACNAATAQYGIEASSKTGLVYVTNSRYCEVMALEVGPSGIFAANGLVVAQEDTGSGPEPLILSTVEVGSSASIATNNVTVSPGISIDLAECSDTSGPCPLVVGDTGKVLAQLSSVDLRTNDSAMTLFQIIGMPDCRYAPSVCVAEFGVPDTTGMGDVANLIAAGFIVPRVSASHPDYLNPAAQRLNMTRLLPAEITSLFAAGELPDLLLESFYRGQPPAGYRFQAFFGRTQDGVAFLDTFEGLYDTLGLTGGNSYDCKAPTDASAPAPGSAAMLAYLRSSDIVVNASERYESPVVAGVNPAPLHSATLENVRCGTVATASVRWSILPYNLEIAPCTFNPDPLDNWSGGGACPVGGPESVDDAVFGKLLLALFDELGGVIDQFVCVPGSELVSLSACATLDAQYLNTLDKLDKCWSATQQPKTSAGSQNCQAFVSQLTGLGNTVAGLPPNPADTANRIGELVARVARLFHVYEQRFAPTIPDGGFVEP